MASERSIKSAAHADYRPGHGLLPLMLIAENMLSTLDISTRLDMFGRMQGLAGRLVVNRRGGKRDIKETWVGQLKRALTEHKYTMLTEPSALPDRGPGELTKRRRRGPTSSSGSCQRRSLGREWRR